MVNQKNACRACSSVPTRSWPWELSIWISVSALVLLCSAWKAAAMNPIYIYLWGAGVSLVAQMVKNLPAMQGTCVQFLGWEDPLVEGVANHSSIFAWGIPWTQEPGGLQSMGLQRGRHNWATNTDKVIWYVCVGCVLCLQTGPFALPVCVLGVLLWRCVCVCVVLIHRLSGCSWVCVCVVLIHRPSSCSWVCVCVFVCVWGCVCVCVCGAYTQALWLFLSLPSTFLPQHLVLLRLPGPWTSLILTWYMVSLYPGLPSSVTFSEVISLTPTKILPPHHTLHCVFFIVLLSHLLLVVLSRWLPERLLSVMSPLLIHCLSLS